MYIYIYIFIESELARNSTQNSYGQAAVEVTHSSEYETTHRGRLPCKHAGDEVCSRFVAEEVAMRNRLDVTQSTYPVNIFGISTSLGATRFKIISSPLLIGLWEIGVAVFNAQQVKRCRYISLVSLFPTGGAGCSSRSCMALAERASSAVTEVLARGGLEEALVMPVVFARRDRFGLVAVECGDFAATADWRRSQVSRERTPMQFGGGSLEGPVHLTRGRLLTSALAWSGS